MPQQHNTSSETRCSIVAALDLTPTRPKSDKKLYRLIHLDNGLEALLVSTAELYGEDVEARNSAAGLAVNVGSFEDPLEAQGLAHFLEHMVFMGSEKYPRENAYDEFVSENGGSSNAWTDAEATVFHFDVLPEAFPKALDIFAQCLATPRLSPDACDRELQAIENEFQIALMSDPSRLQQLWAHTSKPEHPMSKFSWGNLNSLKLVPEANGVDVLAVLRDFHHKYYTTDRMKLVVVSKHSLDELAEMVQESFSALRKPDGVRFDQTRRLGSGSRAHLVRPFQGSVTSMLFQIRPVKRMHRLHLAWPLPPLVTKYRTKPHSIISHLLGHEGEGSVFAHLKQQGFATEIYAGVESSGFEMNTLGSLFIADIHLTLKGLANWPAVVEAMFSYLNMLRASPLDRRIFDELQTIAQIEYDNFDEPESDELVSQLANIMLPIHEHAKEHLLAAETLYFEWAPHEVAELLEYFTPDNTRIDLLSCIYGRVGAEAATHGAGQGSPDDGFRGDDSGSEGLSEEDDEESAYETGSEDDDESEDETGSEEGSDVGSEEGSEHDNHGHAGRGGDRHTQRRESLDTAGTERTEEGDEYEQVLERYLACVDADSPYAALLQPVDESDVPDQEPHFKTEYWTKQLPGWLVQRWRDAPIIDALHLPNANAFIPSNLSLKWTPSDHMALADSPTPVKVHDSDGLHIWHAIDERFPVPKASVYLRFAFKDAASTARSAAVLNLITRLLTDATQEMAYMAAMAELHFSTSMADVGIEIKFSGFADKLATFALSIVKALFDPAQMTKNERLRMQREALERQLTNTALKAGSQVTLMRRRAIKPTKFTPQERLAALQPLSDEELIDDVLNILAHMYVEGLVYGNLTREEAQSFSTELEAVLRQRSADALSDEHLAPERIVKLPDNTTVVLQARSTNAAEQNNAIELYFQHAPIDLMTSAIIDVIEQIMTEPAFNQLRTVEQLCYSLECGSRHTLGVQGYAMKLVSGTHSNNYLMQSALRFLDQFVTYLRELSDETFQLHVQSTIKHKLQPPLNVHDATEHVWGEITIRRYAFHAELQQAEFLRSLSKERLMAVFNELCSPTNPALRLLCCFVEGNSPDTKVQLQDETHATPDSYLVPGRPQPVVVDDAAKLATSCELYPNFV